MTPSTRLSRDGRKKTRVYVTVDVECAEERLKGGQIQEPLGYDLRMWGRFKNQKEDLGIGLLMRMLERHGFRGTFFLEPFGARYFGMPGFREVCEELHGRGHDVQLHSHPIQRNPEYRSRGEAALPDDIAAYDEAEQARLLQEGVGILAEAGIPRAELLAFRAGNFGANNATWAAMKQAGLRLSSNYNPCYFSKNCAMRSSRAEAGLFPTEVTGVYELPITCFREKALRGGEGTYRHLQIAAVSLAETIACIEECRRLGVEEVTIVTHSFELYFIDSVRGRMGRVNRVNHDRFRGLLRYLSENADTLEVDTVGHLAARLESGAEARGKTTFPEGARRLRAARFVSQGYKRLQSRVSFL